MSALLGVWRKLIIWLPLLAAGAEILGAIYFWLVQYELDVTVGQINGTTSDMSRTQLWPGLLLALAIIDIAISIWLYRKQKSTRGLPAITEVTIVVATFVVPLVIFGSVGIWQMSTALGGLEQGFQSAPP